MKIYPTAIMKKGMGEKDWVEVFFNNEELSWVPKLIDLAEILAKIGVCEDEKYNFPEKKVRGAQMVSDFIKEVIDLGITDRQKLGELCDKYQIPK